MVAEQGGVVAPSAATVATAQASVPTRWADPGACTAIVHLILDDRLRAAGYGRCRRFSGDCEGRLSLLRRRRYRQRRRLAPCVDGDSGDDVDCPPTAVALTQLSHQRRPPLPSPLYTEHIAPFLQFGSPVPNMLYVFGGRLPLAGSQTLRPSQDVVYDITEMFDTWHGRWVRCPPMPTCRAGSAAAPLPDGRILVCGGYDARGVVEGLLKSCDVYDPLTECWAQPGGRAAAPLKRARWGHACAPLGGRIYAVGGCSVWQSPTAQHTAFMETLRSCEVYDPSQDAWEPCAPLCVPRSGARVVAASERHLVAVGGCDDPFGRIETQATIEIFDAEAGHWTTVGTRLVVRRTCAAVAPLTGAGSGRLLVAGGCVGEDDGPAIEVCDVPLACHSAEKKEMEEKDEQEESEIEADFAVGAERIMGRLGCQAAVIQIPQPGKAYPSIGHRCLVVVGGERCDRFPDRQLFVAACDMDAHAWREDSLFPQSSTARTAVSVCVGIGRVAPARLA